ncbi:MAG: hypothetical protein QOG62_70 [Thermoleophilaceae bacterium]|jgi:hypothetical protein|nr:hypothetical protein [Thermoleophilaceae bacterium]
MTTSLPEKLVEIHRALAKRRVPHAFGGAIALAYWTSDPRGTSDIDVNIFIPAERPERALRALPEEIAQPDGLAELIAQDGQTRLWWGETPVDVFFDYHPLHEAAAEHRATVPFAGTRIPILGAVELAAFKAIFDRTRDWADIEAMLAAGTLDLSQLRETLGRLVPKDDRRFAKLADAESLAALRQGG